MWLGSQAYDGYPEKSIVDLIRKTERSKHPHRRWRKLVREHLAELDHATFPDEGWPWPWEDSRTTDYAYAFDGHVWISDFGGPWTRYGEERKPGIRCGQSAVFPDMKSVQNIKLGHGSGIAMYAIPLSR